MHYTGMRTAAAALDRLRTPDAEVSAHYLVEEDGTIHLMVNEEKRAWHAGVGKWRGVSDINSASIGIEIVNPGHEFGYQPFPELQMKSVICLSREIVGRHDIKPFNVIGHSDIAPERKTDPGELFDWKMLAENTIGMWPSDTSISVEDDFFENLQVIGYEICDRELVTKAFQRHWRQHEVSGIADTETKKIAAVLRKQVEHLTK